MWVKPDFGKKFVVQKDLLRTESDAAAYAALYLRSISREEPKLLKLKGYHDRPVIAIVPNVMQEGWRNPGLSLDVCLETTSDGMFRVGGSEIVYFLAHPDVTWIVFYDRRNGEIKCLDTRNGPKVEHFKSGIIPWNKEEVA